METKEVEGLITILKNNDFDSYISFLEKNLPKTIYSYYSHSTDILNMISSGKIQLKNPATFNDPFDSLIQEVNKTEIHYFSKIEHTIQKILYSKDKKIRKFRDIILQKNILSNNIDYSQKWKILNDVQKELLSPDNSLEYIELRGIIYEINLPWLTTSPVVVYRIFPRSLRLAPPGCHGTRNSVGPHIPVN